MAAYDFLRNVRAAADYLAPVLPANNPHPTPDDVARAAAVADLWLVPRSVAGFDDPDAFRLPPADRDQLAAAVARFREVAAQVPPGGTPTPQQVADAMAAFVTLFTLLQDRLTTAEEWAAHRAVDAIVRPERDKIPTFRLWFAENWLGEPTAQVKLMLNEERLLDEPGFQTWMGGLRTRIWDAVRPLQPDRFVSVGVWARDEVKERMLGGAA